MEASGADNDQERRRRAKKKKYKGKPNIVIFLVDDVSCLSFAFSPRFVAKGILE